MWHRKLQSFFFSVFHDYLQHFSPHSKSWFLCCLRGILGFKSLFSNLKVIFNLLYFLKDKSLLPPFISELHLLTITFLSSRCKICLSLRLMTWTMSLILAMCHTRVRKASSKLTWRTWATPRQLIWAVTDVCQQIWLLCLLVSFSKQQMSHSRAKMYRGSSMFLL